MAPLFSIWTRVVAVFDFFSGFSKPEYPLQDVLKLPTPTHAIAINDFAPPKYPVFDPPGELEPLPFRCEYPEYPASAGWVSCNSNLDRGCWLKNVKTGQKFDIHTDYETTGLRGIVRDYYLEVTESIRNPDGFGDVPVQLFNGSFPGPRIQGCWGDQLRITIKNKLPMNGTTIHWHGLRQWKTAPMDGVNAISQCPLAPNEEFTYVFNLTQYGTTWYHSHYSLQYAAGLLAPLTIYGPVSRAYDHQQYPLILSDWLHRSVWQKWDDSIFNGKSIFIDNILQNGMGHWPPLNTSSEELALAAKPEFNEVFFQKGVKYLLRLINGAAETTFVFSIDNHKFWVVSADFVAIEPYETDHVVVGIGQRYNIIVEANPVLFTTNQEFWIRTTPAPNCTRFAPPPAPQPDERTGILRYVFNDQLPTSQRNKFEPTCADETYFRNLTPIVPWQVAKTGLEMDPFYLTFNNKVQGFPYYPCKTSNAHFELIPNHPMWLNWTDPAILNVDQDFSAKPWLAEVSTVDTALPDTEWVFLTVVSGAKSTKNPTKPHPLPKKPGVYVPGQHPIHLHGHDFAVLDQCVPDDTTECYLENATWTFNNPPRRDVAFLPDGGYLILAFRADNPGVWM